MSLDKCQPFGPFFSKSGKSLATTFSDPQNFYHFFFGFGPMTRLSNMFFKKGMIVAVQPNFVEYE
jgi:hypothetical protein